MFLRRFLLACAFAVTIFPANAAETLAVAAVRDGSLILADDTEVTLAGVVLADMHKTALTRYVGKKVILVGAKPDRYGRSRALLDLAEGGTVQEALLRAGEAVAYDAAALPQMKKLLDAERAARQAKRGIWADADFVLIPERTKQHLHEFRLVRGTVIKTYRARTVLYLNFGERWQEDFSVTVQKRAWPALDTVLDGMVGRTVLVRGVLTEENGPMITITRSEQMEIE